MEDQVKAFFVLFYLAWKPILLVARLVGCLEQLTFLWARKRKSCSQKEALLHKQICINITHSYTHSYTNMSGLITCLPNSTCIHAYIHAHTYTYICICLFSGLRKCPMSKLHRASASTEGTHAFCMKNKHSLSVRTNLLLRENTCPLVGRNLFYLCSLSLLCFSLLLFCFFSYCYHCQFL